MKFESKPPLIRSINSYYFEQAREKIKNKNHIYSEGTYILIHEDDRYSYFLLNENNEWKDKSFVNNDINFPKNMIRL